MLLRTLGSFELVDSGGEGASTRPFGPQKPLALIAYLALSPGRTATRDQLVDLLWSDSDDDHARQTLRQTIWSLRQRLGDDALRSDGDRIVLSLPLTVDCEEFQSEVVRGDLESAWATYRGHFIPDFAGPGSVEFEHWADLQRDRLRAAWTATGEELARRHINGESPQKAVPIARRLRDEFPDRLDLCRLLLQALLAAGDRMHALVEAEALHARLLTSGARIDAETGGLLERVRAQPVNVVVQSSPPKSALVGREVVFAALLSAWQAAVGGRGKVITIRGAAGLGKTRLMQDFHQRLVDMNARTVKVRARPADRDLPFALVATLAEELASLPGAVGISTASAAALVELAPTLSNTFRRSEGQRIGREERQRVRTLALVELLQAVSEEKPLALLVDDLHWADEPSRLLLDSLGGRVADMPVLLMVSLRPTRGGWSFSPGASLIELQPLTLEQVEELLSSIAIGDRQLQAELGRMFHQMSAGVPLVALAGIELALDRRLLRIVGDRWECQEPDQLQQVLMRGSVLEQLLRDLPTGGLSMLLALALTGRPLDEEVLIAATADPANAPLVTTLEQRGVVTRSGTAWEIAHDRLAESVVTMCRSDERADVARRVGRALIERGAPTMHILKIAGRLFASAGDSETGACFARWMALSRNRTYWRDPVAAAAEFLGEAGTVDACRRLRAALSLRDRFSRGYPRLAMTVGAMLLVGVITTAVFTSRSFANPPAQAFTISEPPHSAGFLWSPVAADVPLESAPTRNPVQIAVLFTDAHGKGTLDTPDSVRVRLIDAPESITIIGAATRPVANGRAEFGDLAVGGRGSFRLEFRAGALPPVRTRRLYSADIRSAAPFMGQLRIVGGALNGQTIDSSRRVIEVAPGEVISGTVSFRSVTSTLDAAMVMGAVALWGDRRTNWMVLRPLPSHGEIVDSLRLADRLSGEQFRAPRRPGRYRILLTAGAETEMKYVVSRTNWMVGVPKWFDGDDLADMGPAQWQALDSAGWTGWYRLAPDEKMSRPVRQTGNLIGATIEVVVR